MDEGQARPGRTRTDRPGSRQGRQVLTSYTGSICSSSPSEGSIWCKAAWEPMITRVAPIGGWVVQDVFSQLAPKLTRPRPFTHPGPRRRPNQHLPARRRGKRHRQPGRTDALGSPPGLGTDGIGQLCPPDPFPEVTRAALNKSSFYGLPSLILLPQT